MTITVSPRAGGDDGGDDGLFGDPDLAADDLDGEPDGNDVTGGCAAGGGGAGTGLVLLAGVLIARRRRR